MNGRMRTKAGLLSRVSTLALIATAGSLGAAERAEAACDTPLVVTPGVISGTHECATANGVGGNVTNNGTIGPPGDGDPGFFVGSGGIAGTLLNSNVIAGGGTTYYGEVFGALTITGNVSGGVRNEGIISSETGSAIQLGFQPFEGPTQNAAMTGVITNSAAITSTLGDGVAARFGSTTGGLVNEGNSTISGGNRGVYISDGFTSWGGGIQNSGQILGNNAAVQVGSLYYSGASSVDFYGGIHNYYGATTSSLNGPTIVAGGDSFNGGITNHGLITQRNLAAAQGEGPHAGVGIVVTAETFGDGIYNTGTINGLGGPAIWVTSHTTNFNGNTGDLLTSNDGIVNAGVIQGVDNGIKIESTNFTGNLVNHPWASIVSTSMDGDGVFADTQWYGDVENAGLIEGGDNGFEFAGDSYLGDFRNTGTIMGSGGGVVFSYSEMSIGNVDESTQFVNQNRIEGGSYGVRIDADLVYADFSNTKAVGTSAPIPTITSDWGTAVRLAASTWSGNVVNEGVIEGPSSEGVGLEIDVAAWNGNIENRAGALINGGYRGAEIYAGAFNGSIINHGRIIGGTIGEDDVVTGGDTGLYVSASTFNGDITNNGTIVGGGIDTGLHIVTAGTHTGNIVNNGLIEAVDNALRIDITSLDVTFDEELGEQTSGLILNNDTIRATGYGWGYETAVSLTIDNGATFVNDGSIFGDVFFSGKAAYVFVGQEGSITGDLVGYGGESGSYTDDIIIVRNGEQYFAGGTAYDFASFTVENGGTAHMGGAASGYAFSNVNALNVDTGGTLFIDRPTTLHVDGDYTQQAGGTLAFYLGAPEGESFSDLTGTVEANNDTDYGQLIVHGTANLDGRIVGELDPAFANANPGLDTVVYNDVLIADEINGTFDEASLLQNSAIFQLSYDINPGDGVQTVDLFVNRTPLGHTSLGGLVVEATASFDNAVSSKLSMGGGCGGVFAGPGWCVTQYAANETGATQVLTDATPGEDPFTWLRARGRRAGETAAWGRVVGGWGDTDGDATTAGAKFDNVGGIVGVDHVFTPTLLAGLAAQWTATDIDFKGRPDKADVDSLEIGAYASYAEQNLYLNANVSYIWHEFDVRRFIGPDRALGDYDGTTISAYAEGGKTFQTEGDVLIQPFIALSYSHLDTDAYAETGTNPGVQLNVQSTDFDSLRSSVGVRVGYPIQMSSGRMMVPEVRAGWAHEFLDDQSTFVATLQSGGPPVLITGEKYSRDTLVVGAGVSVPLADQVVAFVDYDTGLNDDITTHTVSGGLRVKW